MSCACATASSGGALRWSRDSSVHSAERAPPRTYTSWFSPDQAPGLTRSLPSPPVRDRIAPVAESSARWKPPARSEEHTSELQSLAYLVCRLLLEKKKNKNKQKCEKKT